MRSTIIKTVIAISVSFALFPKLASATTPSFSCSSNLVISLDNVYNASCEGDFSFTDGVLQNDTSISLTAGGSIVIGSNFELASPIINLNADNIQIDGRISANLELNASTLPKGYLSSLDWQPSSGIVVTQDNSQTLSVKYLDLPLLPDLFKPYPVSGGNINLVSQVPEPSNYALMLLGLATLGLKRKRKAS
ncbi:MAG: hypothetical protein BVN34_00735 [Proteobacteria bacterium ST_bin12]|nr:MAG: hypothetical protein BVN34_00735 [Proteobacteria bacterium ST_bin12]